MHFNVKGVIDHPPPTLLSYLAQELDTQEARVKNGKSECMKSGNCNNYVKTFESASVTRRV